MDIKPPNPTPNGTSPCIKNANTINIVLGRNGAGKSRFLRELDLLMSLSPNLFRTIYVSPERTGSFKRDAGVESNTSNDAGWERTVRRANQAHSFKSMSHLALRNAERIYLMGLEGTDAREKSFDRDCLDPISRMLNNISITRNAMDFEFSNSTGAIVNAEELSSGESETIALAAEILRFIFTIDKTKLNVLLLDEPDVHQHPDLQARFGKYLLDSINSLDEELQKKVAICIATHSTPLVCALASSKLTSIGTKEYENTNIVMESPDDKLRKVAPFFGHPLSLSLSSDPILILEGEDDERVWQQAARSSQGKVRLFPVLAASVNQQSELEKFADLMLRAIYDDPLAYSLRDGDGIREGLNNLGCVARFRLYCYAIENTLVTTECLKKMNVDSWPDFVAKTNKWIEKNDGHNAITQLRQLIDSKDRLRNVKIKDIRHIIVAVTETKKPWEVIVGQALADTIGTTSQPQDEFGLLCFLGADAAKKLLHAA